MSYTITVTGHGPVDDDLRDAFGGLVRALRDATPDGPGSSLAASLSTGSATYDADDIPDLVADDDLDDDDPAEDLED